MTMLPKKTKRRVTMLNRFPCHTPPLDVMLGDLGEPSAGEVGRALGVDRSTVSGWLRRGQAPRPALLALYYLTRWGHSDVHCQAHNDAQTLAMTVEVLRGQLETAMAQLSRLGQIGEFGSANDPTPGTATTPAEPLASGPKHRENRSRTSEATPVSHRKTKRFAHEN